VRRTRVIPAIPEKIVYEDIQGYTVTNTSISVSVAVCSDDGIYDDSYPTEVITIQGADLTELLSLNAAGHIQGKPANTFRRDDLWVFVDLLRARGGSIAGAARNTRRDAAAFSPQF